MNMPILASFSDTIRSLPFAVIGILVGGVMIWMVVSTIKRRS